MASESTNSEYISTLELREPSNTLIIPDFDTIPENDLPGTRLGIENTVVPPEVAFEQTPEAHRISTAPEAIENDTGRHSDPDSYDNYVSEKAFDFMRSVHEILKKIVLMLGALLALALLLVLGFGIQLAADNTASTKSDLPIPDTSSFHPALATPHETPYYPNPPLEHCVLEGTPLASVRLLSGERFVFFQDDSGSIHQKTYSQSNLLLASMSSIVTTNAQRSSPLAAFTSPSKIPDNGEPNQETIYLFYIAQNLSLALVYCTINSTVAPKQYSFREDFTKTSGLVAANHSNYLAVSPFFGVNQSSWSGVILLYEDSQHNMRIVAARVNESNWRWMHFDGTQLIHLFNEQLRLANEFLFSAIGISSIASCPCDVYVFGRTEIAHSLCTANLRYNDSGYSDNLGYSDTFVRIKLVKLV
ncbi:MAG: hypothetical protein Q9190_000475 [Brigantiaea leucoxantha]